LLKDSCKKLFRLRDNKFFIRQAFVPVTEKRSRLHDYAILREANDLFTKFITRYTSADTVIPKIMGSSSSGSLSPDTIRPKVTEPPEIIDHNDASLSGLLVKSAATTGIIIPDTINEYE
jgi:hypothetical protein